MILMIFFWHLISGRKCVTSVSSNFTTIHAIWKYICLTVCLLAYFLAIYIMPIARDTIFLM